MGLKADGPALACYQGGITGTGARIIVVIDVFGARFVVQGAKHIIQRHGRKLVAAAAEIGQCGILGEVDRSKLIAPEVEVNKEWVLGNVECTKGIFPTAQIQ